MRCPRLDGTLSKEGKMKAARFPVSLPCERDLRDTWDRGGQAGNLPIGRVRPVGLVAFPLSLLYDTIPLSLIHARVSVDVRMWLQRNTVRFPWRTVGITRTDGRCSKTTCFRRIIRNITRFKPTMGTVEPGSVSSRQQNSKLLK